MTKTQLIEEIEAYAAAKSTGNVTLMQRSAAMLKQLLDKLPEELLPEPKAD